MTAFCEHGQETTGYVQEGQFLRQRTTFQGRLFIVKFHKIRGYDPKFQQQTIIEGCVTPVTQHIAVFSIGDFTCTEQRAATDTCCSGAEEAGCKVPPREECHFTTEAAENRIP